MRVVHARQSGGVVAVCRAWAVGFRKEVTVPFGTSHLLEHLMAGPHSVTGRWAAPGFSLAESRRDYTVYGTLGAVGQLRELLTREARRMAYTRWDTDAIRHEAAMIAEEYRVLVESRPHGRFPRWSVIDHLYPTRGETSDGYGSYAELAEIAPEDLAAFATSGHDASRSVICVLADVSSDHLRDLVDDVFSDLPDGGDARPVPARFDEAPPLAARTVTLRNTRVPRGLAVAWPLVSETLLELMCATFALRCLTTSTGGLQRLVDRHAPGTRVQGWVGWQDDPYREASPTSLTVYLENLHQDVPLACAGSLVEWIASSLEDLDNLAAAAETTASAWRLQLASLLDDPLERAHFLASHHLLHADEARPTPPVPVPVPAMLDPAQLERIICGRPPITIWSSPTDRGGN